MNSAMNSILKNTKRIVISRVVSNTGLSINKSLVAIKPFVFGTALAMLAACATTQQPSTPVSVVAGLQVVDCLLPGQLRQLGNSQFLTPRRPITTTAADCSIRGGEFVAYDRADYRTALNVWLPSAEGGDAEAQVNVGEIFERGLGDNPNYEAAIIWYERAAEQGNARAQFNLGTLYEQGLGVAPNKLQALNWYRLAWGLPEGDDIYQGAGFKEVEEQRNQLQNLLQESNIQIELLNRQLQQLQSQANTTQTNADTEQQAELDTLRNLVERLQGESRATQNQIANLPIFRNPSVVSVATPNRATSLSANSAATSSISFGRYYALIIGNQNYTNMDNLFSPHNDARDVAQVLESKYGFSVQVLLDASNIEVMQAINDLDAVLGEDDNLLIFYAGHGNRVASGDHEDGYWLPVNADPAPTDTFWVSNEFITRHLARFKAKRVLVIADSCYGGLLSTEPGYLFMGDEQAYSPEYLNYKLPKRSRLILSSGGDQPVLDNAGQGHSVFAKAFLDVLESNNGIMAAPQLYIDIRDQVRQGASTLGVEQEPEFQVIKGARHEVGDFFFVPTRV